MKTENSFNQNKNGVNWLQRWKSPELRGSYFFKINETILWHQGKIYITAQVKTETPQKHGACLSSGHPHYGVRDCSHIWAHEVTHWNNPTAWRRQVPYFTDGIPEALGESVAQCQTTRSGPQVFRFLVQGSAHCMTTSTFLGTESAS